jgi:hypothetical protein
LADDRRNPSERGRSRKTGVAGRFAVFFARGILVSSLRDNRKLASYEVAGKSAREISS